ncbi:MAG: HD domain-containing protein [Coprobacillus sp.]|nr:HD domain-containing protein [Coprobacillus sp.]
MKLISEFVKDEKVATQLLVNNVSKSTSSVGSTYLNVELKDNSGTIYAKKWEPSEADEEALVAGSIVYIEGEVTLYKSNLQLKINSVTPLDASEVDLARFTKESPLSLEELDKKLSYYIDSISDPLLKKTVNIALTRYDKEFHNLPAGKNIHHDYRHGLLTHVISMAEIAEFLCAHYGDTDYDMLMSATLLHDIGKSKELEGDVSYSYTLEGKLLGHISLGEVIVSEAASEAGLDKEKTTVLLHMILSHHGQLEFGSPVLPQTKEALLLSLIDSLDSKMAAVTKALDGVAAGESSPKVYALDNRTFYKPKK